MAHAPVVMLSSTYYDLKQIRKDIAEFIEGELGYQALMSESSTFPIDPDVGTIENCLRRVEKQADIFVLIIGGRYGYVSSNANMSVTNLEYSSARAKGIPIYAFVDKRVLPLVSIWQQNPSADFSSSVDNPQLFEFIHQIRSIDQVWTHEFENGQDIVSSLRQQFAYMMSKGLGMIQRTCQIRDSRALQGLSGRALQLALEKPRCWEASFLCACLQTEIDASARERMWQDNGIAIGPGEALHEDALTIQWMGDRFEELTRLVEAINRVFGDLVKAAFTEEGQHGDVMQLRQVSSMAAELYRQSLAFSQRVRRAHVGEMWADLIGAFSTDCGEIARALGDLPAYVDGEVKAFLTSTHTNSHERLVIKHTFHVDLGRSIEAMNKLNEHYKNVLTQLGM